MLGKRVTYLIGAGASANALPVVGSLTLKLKIFIEELKVAIQILNKDDNLSHKQFEIQDLDHIEKIVDEISKYKTIDTFAKKLYLIEDTDKYRKVKILLTSYLIYEQLDRNTDYFESINSKYLEKYDSKKVEDKDKLDDKLRLRKLYFNNLDSRYESLFTSLLEIQKPYPIIPNHINFVTWNYDMQFEIAYKDYCNSNVETIQQILNIFPSPKVNFDSSKSTIIRLNGAGNFLYIMNKSQQNESLLYEFNLPRAKYDKTNLEYLIKHLSIKSIPKEYNQLVFAWENDDIVSKARQNAQNLISYSDAVVVIGYSFPTFNREIDRQLFKVFDGNCKGLSKKPSKKIYIQDTPENAPKIKERLKAIGNNLFDVAEIYTEVDQFFIPPEL